MEKEETTEVRTEFKELSESDIERAIEDTFFGDQQENEAGAGWV